MKIIKKLTKKQANKALADGLYVGAIASKLNPYFGNNCFIVTLHKEFVGNNAISDGWINSFKYYNCTKETGHGISFYLIEEDREIKQ